MMGTVMIQGNKIWEVDSSVRFRRLFDEAILIRQEKPYTQRIVSKTHRKCVCSSHRLMPKRSRDCNLPAFTRVYR